MTRFIITSSYLVLMGCASILPLNDSEIQISEIREHITFLASDALEGRQPGTDGGQAAADYVARHFSELGLTPLGENGFQSFQVITSVSLGENSFSSEGLAAKPGIDYTPASFSENAKLAAKSVFVGYGFEIDTDTLKWNDYEGVDVKGKWVLILRGSPESGSTSIDFDRHATLRHKVLTARDHEAAGIIFISGPTFDEKDELLELRIDRNFSKTSLPVLHVKRGIADQLIAEKSISIEALESSLGTEMKSNSFELDRLISANVQIVQNKVTTQNVLGMLEGDDPQLKDEYLLIGAHYDHLGWGGVGSGSRRPDTTAIHNGADDNASGVAAILEVAEKFAKGEFKSRRSLVFMAFAAEEMGLLGSKHFTTNPLIELTQIKHMFNLDMVGRMDPGTRIVTVGGTGTAEGIEKILSEIAAEHEINLAMTPDGYGPSDHASFYIEDIPVLFFFTGITEEYHTPDDDVETINIPGEKVIADFSFDLIHHIANLDTGLTFKEAGPKGPPKAGKRGNIKMGIIPDFAAADANGFLLGGVVPGGPAALAGLKKGDVMVSMEGRSIKNIYDYMGRMADVKPGQRVSVEVLRAGEKQILIVQL